ncbi:MAG: hypothetical protein H5U02_05625 [Clostridia bacterium]|nr:hypothetical protein [Clostridia bacterium]
MDIYERFFARDECRKIIREIERGGGERFWNSLKDGRSRGELDEIDLDEYLGYFELLGALVCRKAIDFKNVYDLFGYCIEAAWKHQAIREYIETVCRDKKDPDIYEHFQHVAKQVTAHSPRKGIGGWWKRYGKCCRGGEGPGGNSGEGGL